MLGNEMPVEKKKYTRESIAEQYATSKDALELTNIVVAALQISLGIQLRENQLQALNASGNNELISMDTGEGKTYVAACWAAVKAKNTQIHIATSNEYLAERDYNLLRPFYDILNITNSLVPDTLDRQEKLERYKSKIVYGRISTFLADTLTDLSTVDYENRMIGEEVALVLDEADYALIDSSLHPYSIVTDTQLRNEHHELVGNALKKITLEDIGYHEKTGLYYVTEEGYRKLESLGVSVQNNLEYAQPLKDTLYALYSLNEGIDYVVSYDKGEASISLLSNGALDPNKKLSSGVMKALTYKLLDTHPSLCKPKDLQIINQLTLKTLLSRYKGVFALTGPATELEINEVINRFNLNYRKIHPSTISKMEEVEHYYLSKSEKREAMLEYIKTIAARKDPLLIITASDLEIVELCKELNAVGVKSETLFSTDVASRSAILQKLAKPGNIVIGNQQVGRGVDIKIAENSNAKLHVISSSYPETERSYLQARGRTARNGEMGVYALFASLDEVSSDVAKSAETLLRGSHSKENKEEIIKKVLQKNRKRQEDVAMLSRHLITKPHSMVEPLNISHIHLRGKIIAMNYKELLTELTTYNYNSQLWICPILPVKRESIVKKLQGVFPGYVPAKKMSMSKNGYINILTEIVIDHVNNRLSILTEAEKASVIKRFVLPIFDANYSVYLNQVNIAIRDQQYLGYKITNPDIDFTEICIQEYKKTKNTSYREMLSKVLQLEIKETDGEDPRNLGS